MSDKERDAISALVDAIEDVMATASIPLPDWVKKEFGSAVGKATEAFPWLAES